ncbi:hypothetical protein ACFORL_12435 [Legionella dresdenensis]|uniref:Antitoxin n=1 Tax=Legionella dresdenensis TaxID=450200 RepID=A0ABV8CIH0_9GAMM
MVALTKVSMNLTDRDISNTEKIKNRLHSRSKADAVSAALSITSSLSDYIERGEEIFVLTKDGKTERLVIPGLQSK